MATLGFIGLGAMGAPMAGGVSAAEAGTLSIMVGGDAGVYERCRALLATIGQTITYIGKSGAGQVAKAVNSAI
jgi:3-hydroxyisobutyrate dehydrogenase-like beta-hydroxyacid dehydrogenase